MKRYLLILAAVLTLASCSPEASPSKETAAFVTEKIPAPEIPVKSVPQASSSKGSPVCSIGVSAQTINTTYAISSVPDRTMLDRFFEETALGKELFVVNANSDTVVIGRKGTEIFIPANCFHYKGSSEGPKGDVAIDLKECYNYADIMAQNLSTKNNDNQLRSAGMICLNATADGKELELKEGAELPVNFNTSVDNDSYDLYYGNRDKNNVMNWDVGHRLACTAAPVLIMTEGSEMESGKRFIEDQYTFSKEELIALQNRNWNTSVSFNERGEVVGATKGDEKEEVVLYALKKFNGLIKNYHDHVRNTAFPSWGHHFGFTCVSSDSAGKLNAEGFRAKLALNNFINPKRTFYARRMGWLNCDQINILKPLAVAANFIIDAVVLAVKKHRDTFNAEVTLGNSPDNTDIKLVYKKDKTIVPGKIIGNKCFFNDVVTGKEFVIVATKCTADGIYYCAKDERSLDGNDIKINLAYRKYSTPQEVIVEYKKLDAQLE